MKLDLSTLTGAQQPYMIPDNFEPKSTKHVRRKTLGETHNVDSFKKVTH